MFNASQELNGEEPMVYNATNKSFKCDRHGRSQIGLGPILRQVRIPSRWHESNNRFEQYSVNHDIMPAISGVPPCTYRQNMSAP